jgi:predicted O-methyltransferase YrrM
MLDQVTVEKMIKKISYEVKNYKIREDLLYRFTEAKEDREFLSYINGVGGNYPKFLALLVKYFNFKNIVELGNREGLSTLCIYEGMSPESRFVSVDLVKDLRYCPEVMFTDPRVEFVYGDVCDLEIFRDKIMVDIDFLFTDTIHFDFQLRDEWSVYQHLLSDKSLVAIDDINTNDKRKLFDELQFKKWDLTEVCHVSGWGLFLFERKKPMSKEERILNAYKASAKIWRRKYLELEREKDAAEKRKIINKVIMFIRSNKILHENIIKIKKFLKLT